MREEELIRRAKEGSMQAFGELVDLYSPVVQRFAYQLGSDYDEVDDITQEVFLRVYRFIEQFSHAKFTTWLYKITLNVSRDMVRKKQQQLKKVIKLHSERQVGTMVVETDILKTEQDLILHQCIQSLDEKYRVPIILFYFHEKKYEEISDILGVTLSTVKTRLLRGKDALKKALREVEKKEGKDHG